MSSISIRCIRHNEMKKEISDGIFYMFVGFAIVLELVILVAGGIKPVDIFQETIVMGSVIVSMILVFYGHHKIMFSKS